MWTWFMAPVETLQVPVPWYGVVILYSQFMYVPRDPYADGNGRMRLPGCQQERRVGDDLLLLLDGEVGHARIFGGDGARQIRKFDAGEPTISRCSGWRTSVAACMVLLPELSDQATAVA